MLELVWNVLLSLSSSMVIDLLVKLHQFVLLGQSGMAQNVKRLKNLVILRSTKLQMERLLIPAMDPLEIVRMVNGIIQEIINV